MCGGPGGGGGGYNGGYNAGAAQGSTGSYGPNAPNSTGTGMGGDGSGGSYGYGGGPGGGYVAAEQAPAPVVDAAPPVYVDPNTGATTQMYADAGAALQADQEAAAQQAAIAEASTYDGTMPDTQPPAEVTAATPVPLTPDQQYAQDSEAWATVKDIFNSPVIKYGAQALSLAVAPAAAIKGMLTQAAFGVLGNVANKYAANNPGTVGANAINAANNIGNVLSGGMGLFNAGNTVMRAGPAAAAGNLAAALALGRSISSVPARANQMQAGLTGLGVPSAQTGMAAGDSGGLTSTGGGGNVVAYTGAPSAGAMPPLQPTALRVLRAPPPRGQGMMSQNTRVLRAPRPIGA